MRYIVRASLRALFFISMLIPFHHIAYSQAAEIARITVDAGKYDRANSLVSTSLEGMNIDLAESECVLYKLSGINEKKVDSQLDMEGSPKLWWKLNELAAGNSQNYILKKEPANQNESISRVLVSNDHGNLIVSVEGKNVLQYNYRYAPQPEGVPDIYQRAGYIHPLWSPKGEVLSRIQPPDHYHHYGLWNPWTHTEFKGKVIDFWNLAKGEGTVKPISVISTTSNDLYGGFRVLQDHIDLNGKTPTGAEVAMKEIWNVRVWNVTDNSRLIDFTSSMNCATDSILKIIQYRYQGFGFRATEKWDDKTSTLLTSQGKNKEDGNSTRARWCDVNGISDFGTSGVLFITHPSNYNYPEPIRIWPTGSNGGKENVFFNFNPAMDRDWILKPGNDYQLKYRMFVYDGKISKEDAEQLWADFAHPPSVSMQVTDPK